MNFFAKEFTNESLNEELNSLFTKEELRGSIGDPAEVIAKTTHEYAAVNRSFIFACCCQPTVVKIKALRFLAKCLRYQAEQMEAACDDTEKKHVAEII